MRHVRFLPLALLSTALLLAACAGPAPRPVVSDSLDAVAEGYVRAVLALGEHDAAYVDAYYGAESIRTEAKAERPALAVIQQRAEALLAQMPPLPAEPLSAQRHAYLQRQLQALISRTRQLQGTVLSFDAEAQAMYDIRPPAVSEAALQAAVDAVAAQLPPGEGDVATRYNAYLDGFAISAERLPTVMHAAIAEARRRTQARLALPEGESFELAFVTQQAWSAYNWYQGNYRSRIEINTDLPVTAIRAIELAVHEGYPGHHVYNALLEQRLVREHGWIEYSVYPLYSPQSLIAEGTADYGVELSFPPHSQVEFLRNVLFPLAGLDATQAERYVAITQAAHGLGAATVEAARRYLDGHADAAATVAFLQRYALASPARARQRIAFFDSLRSYIVNYSLGEALVADYMRRSAGDDPDRRWAVFRELISSPQLPGALAAPQPP